MAACSVADFATFINLQITIQERLEGYLQRLQSLIEIILAIENFQDFSKNTLDNYLLLANDLIKDIAKGNQESLTGLLNFKAL